VAAALVVQPKHRNFGSVVFGARGATSKPRIVTLHNRSSSAMVLMDTAVAGDFSIDAGSTTCAAALGPHGHCAYAILFTPADLGRRQGSLTITDNAANSPQTIALTGKGVPGAIHIAPKRINFGKIPITSAGVQRTVSIANPNPVPLEISGVAVSGAGFAIADGCTGELAAHAACSIAVTFAPKSGASAKGTVTISDDAAQSPQAVRLSGRGAP
jgi:Abnormal spindle-like microcephaly-assoc'd, ASPM-SPD-2-Hydin